MAGLYDWLFNGLNADQSPATSQLPAPIAPQTSPMNAPTGTPAGMPATASGSNPLRTYMIQKYLANMTQGGQQGKQPMPAAAIPSAVGQQKNIPVTNPMQPPANNLRMQMLMKQMYGSPDQQTPMTPYG